MKGKEAAPPLNVASFYDTLFLGRAKPSQAVPPKSQTTPIYPLLHHKQPLEDLVSHYRHPRFSMCLAPNPFSNQRQICSQSRCKRFVARRLDIGLRSRGVPAQPRGYETDGEDRGILFF